MLPCWGDTVLGICPPEGPAAASQPTILPRIPEQGLGELEQVAQELQALHEELLEAGAARRVAWEAQVGGLGRGPQWSSVRRASQEAVDQELAALQRSWEQDRGPTPPQGPHRLVRREESAARTQGLQAAGLAKLLGLLGKELARQGSFGSRHPDADGLWTCPPRVGTCPGPD
uniref:Uncharacterized protein n=1 Tax=Spermophilus dauricus TaxID=99837 RepID=A0A8C9QI29_SPEDA